MDRDNIIVAAFIAVAVGLIAALGWFGWDVHQWYEKAEIEAMDSKEPLNTLIYEETGSIRPLLNQEEDFHPYMTEERLLYDRLGIRIYGSYSYHETRNKVYINILVDNQTDTCVNFNVYAIDPETQSNSQESQRNYVLPKAHYVGGIDAGEKGLDRFLFEDFKGQDLRDLSYLVNVQVPGRLFHPTRELADFEIQLVK